MIRRVVLCLSCAYLIPAAAGGASTSTHGRITVLPDDRITIARFGWQCGSVGSVNSGVSAGCSSPAHTGGPFVGWTQSGAVGVISSARPKLTSHFDSGRRYTYAFPFRSGTTSRSFVSGRDLRLQPGEAFAFAGLPSWTCRLAANGARFTCTDGTRPSLTLIQGAEALYVGADRQVVSTQSPIPNVRGYAWP